MPDHEARERVFYDHETEEPGSAPRRRHVADWGVGEDVFDRLPSRRFTRRRGDGPDTREHRRAELAEDRETDGADLHGPQWSDEPDAYTARRGGEPSTRDRAPGARDADAPAPRTIVITGPVEDFPDAAFDPDPDPDPEPAPRLESQPRVAAAGRRTVVIGGHPDRLAPVDRRRPPRTVSERVGPRPDRIVAYAVALGFLLILIAILTAGH
jgi:hypothetical protein